MPAIPPGKAAASTVVAGGVRFFLSELLNELGQERASGTVAKALLDQAEIRKRFKAKAPRRARPAT